MTDFTVIWWPPAQEDLATIWLNTSIRQAVTHAANEIERELGVNPEAKGESKHEGLRELAIAPLTVQFSTDADDRRVTIWSVKLTT